MKPSETLQIELERRILRGLRLEWENARFELPSEMAAHMQPPLFRLSDAERRLGGWDPRRKEIFLSRLLVLNHPWDAVCDVLRHEMAHQLVEVCWSGAGARPHGTRFRQACHLLRAVPDASGTYPTLDQRVFDESASPDDRILRRIRKLMALSDSPNVHEAEAAMVKAHALIAKYNLDLAACEAQRRFVSVFLGQPALRHFREAYALGQLLQHYYFIEAVWVPAYVVAKGKMGRVLEISGTCANVQIAAYVYDFVNTYIDGVWERFQAGKKLGRHRKTDFAVGVIEGFTAKLEPTESAAEEGHAKIRALVRREDVALKSYMSHRYPRLSRVRRGGQMDPEVHAAGKAEGWKMVISKGISDNGSSAAPALLPDRN
jgi:hypothetical protein